MVTAKQALKKCDLIEDPTIEEDFEGMYCGAPNYYNDAPLNFDLRKADSYIRKKGLMRSQRT